MARSPSLFGPKSNLVHTYEEHRNDQPISPESSLGRARSNDDVPDGVLDVVQPPDDPGAGAEVPGVRDGASPGCRERARRGDPVARLAGHGA